jgi:pyruvate formate lyase activating enzyme
MKYIYCGNIHAGEAGDTYCPVCGELLIRRGYMNVIENKIESGRCRSCSARIAGVFD